MEKIDDREAIRKYICSAKRKLDLLTACRNDMHVEDFADEVVKSNERTLQAMVDFLEFLNEEEAKEDNDCIYSGISDLVNAMDGCKAGKNTISVPHALYILANAVQEIQELIISGEDE